jgi:hypothetical protein
MPGTSLDFPTLVIVIVGALLAGFTTGFAGFGTGLVASGIWFHALPAAMVPPLVALASVAAQIVGLVTVRKAFDWSRAKPYLVGGVIGVPFGVAALAAASPFLLRASIGAFLIAYATYQLLQRRQREIAGWGGKAADGVIGVGGGFLGGFAGLSGPLPLIWLQLRGGDSASQRATLSALQCDRAGAGQRWDVDQRADHVTRALDCTLVPSGHPDRSVDRCAGLCRGVGADLSTRGAEPLARIRLHLDRTGADLAT